MEVRLLGSLELTDGGLPVAVGGVRQRAVLALLVLHANEVVPAERLLVELWGEDAPPTAANALQAAVSRLRRALPQGRLLTRPVGYLFRAAPDEVDAQRFERLLADGREALARGAPEEAVGILRRALSLWRGPALADFRFDPFAQAEIARLEELRLVCVEERVEADLALGAAGELVGELQRLTAEQPLRERLRGQLMLALYRSDRQADALEAYRELRSVLAEELGLEPAPALRELEAAILRQDASLEAPTAPPPASAPAPARKPVTVPCVELGIAAGAAGGLDPEALDAVLGDAVVVLGTTLERHGGRLAAVAGERVLGVFGDPTLHEDDALRAARAALAGRDALGAAAAAVEQERGPRLTVRCGLATGEALVGAPDPPGVRSDAVGRAVELATSAAAGELLVDEETRQLAAGALEVEHAGPGRLRLRAAQVGARPRAVRLDAPLVGRDQERSRLGEAFMLALRERAPVLATVLGEAGIGKTRLAPELAAQVAAEAAVLTGSCLPYGEGITFWPLRELVRQAGAVDGTREQLEALLAGEADAGRVAEYLSAALSSRGQGVISAAEIFWAARRLLETLARREPLLVVLEDLHWAEPTFLDLVETLAAQAEDAPMLLLCWRVPSSWSSARAGRPGRGGPCPSSWSRSPTTTRPCCSTHSRGRRRQDWGVGSCWGRPPATRCSWSSWWRRWANGAGRRAGRRCPRPSRPCSPPAFSGLGRPSARCSPTPPSSARTSRRRRSPSSCPRRRGLPWHATCTRWWPRGSCSRGGPTRAPARSSGSGTSSSSRLPTGRCRSRCAPTSTSASWTGWSGSPAHRRTTTRSSATTSSRPTATAPSWDAPARGSGRWPPRPRSGWAPRRAAR